MWTYFLISCFFSNVELSSAYYLAPSYYQETLKYVYPQFYAPNNDVPLNCFIYFPGFIYYHQPQSQEYPMMMPFYEHSIYQMRIANVMSKPKSFSTSNVKINAKEAESPFRTKYPLPFIGLPVLVGHMKTTQKPSEYEGFSSTSTERVEIPTTQSSSKPAPPNQVTPFIGVPLFTTQVGILHPSSSKAKEDAFSTNTERDLITTPAANSRFTPQNQGVPFIGVPLFTGQIETVEPAHTYRPTQEASGIEESTSTSTATESTFIRELTTPAIKAPYSILNEWEPTPDTNRGIPPENVLIEDGSGDEDILFDDEA